MTDKFATEYMVNVIKNSDNQSQEFIDDMRYIEKIIQNETLPLTYFGRWAKHSIKEKLQKKYPEHWGAVQKEMKEKKLCIITEKDVD